MLTVFSIQQTTTMENRFQEVVLCLNITLCQYLEWLYKQRDLCIPLHPVHVHGQFSTDFELKRLEHFFLNQNSILNPKRPNHQHTERWTMQGLMEPFFYIVGCCNFTMAKSYEVYSFIGQRAISQGQNDSCSKTLCLVVKYVRNCRSGVLFVSC